jgi:hypothetical protein
MDRNHACSTPRRVTHLLNLAAVILVLFVASCSDAALPTAPTDPQTNVPPTTTTKSAFIGNIMDAATHRRCIPNGQAEIIGGPAAGTVYAQNLDHCEDPGAGFNIEGLTLGSVLRLRVSAPGYVTLEADYVVVGHSVDINLDRVQ